MAVRELGDPVQETRFFDLQNLLIKNLKRFDKLNGLGDAGNDIEIKAAEAVKKIEQATPDSIVEVLMADHSFFLIHATNGMAALDLNKIRDVIVYLYSDEVKRRTAIGMDATRVCYYLIGKGAGLVEGSKK